MTRAYEKKLSSDLKWNKRVTHRAIKCGGITRRKQIDGFMLRHQNPFVLVSIFSFLVLVHVSVPEKISI